MKKNIIITTISIIIISLLLILILLNNSNVIHINSVKDLIEIKNNEDIKKVYKLEKDLDLKNIEWEPIKNFNATFDGKNHTIKNLKVTNKYGGLFSNVSGTIQNLTIICDIDNDYSGAFASRFDEGSVIDNCHVYGKVGSESKIRVGGFASDAINAKIINSTNHAEIKGATDVGGIVAYAYNLYNDLMIFNCQNFGNLSGKTNVGGIIGNVFADAKVSNNNPHTYGNNYIKIENCQNNGEIVATGDNIGGICGYVKGTSSTYQASKDSEVLSADSYVHLINSINSADITGVNAVGGIIGYAVKWVEEFSGALNTGNITGEKYVGGIIGHNNSRQIKNSQNKGIITGNTYVGGISGKTSSASGCTNYGVINGYRYVGGIMGEHFGELATSDCNNHGEIKGESTYIGGIVGTSTKKTAELNNCNNYALVTSNSKVNIGAIIGNSSQMIINNCNDYSKE